MPFNLWILCLDSKTFTTLKNLSLPGIELISLDQLEQDNPALLKVRPTRSRVEYYFTCSPILPLYIMDHWPMVDIITYIDADILFFSNPEPLFKELDCGSIGITEHRFPQHLRYLEQRGIYNVGWISLRNDHYSRECLFWWRERCLEWCYDRYELGRYADEKYLDYWPMLFNRVVVLHHKGANVAPWNIDNYTISFDGNKILVDGCPLLFFHFHGLTQLNRWIYGLGLEKYHSHASPVVLSHIFIPYIKLLIQLSVGRRIGNSTRYTVHYNIKQYLRVVRGMCNGRYVIVR